MVRRNILGDAAEPEEAPRRRPSLMRDAEADHAAYWSEEAVERRRRFAATVDVPSIEEAFHIRDGFRIVCDGLPEGREGKRCDNVIGFAPLPLQHDGLCERCRRMGYDFQPRITESPLRVVSDQRSLHELRQSASSRGDAYESEEADAPPPQ